MLWNLVKCGVSKKLNCANKLSKDAFDCCRKWSWHFGRSAWVLVMIKPHANLCPLNQSVDSMSPNTWEHFSSGKWRVAFCLTWFRLMDCSWNWCCPILALALLVHGHASEDSFTVRIADVFSCLLRVFERYGLWLNQVVAVLSQIVLTFWIEVLECLWWSNHMLTYVHWIKVWILWVLTPESTSLRANDVLHSAWLGSDGWTVLEMLVVRF